MEFKRTFRPPFPTNELTKTIFNEYNKVFESDNFFSKYEFTQPELAIDIESYRKKIKDDVFFKTEGARALKTSINSALIIDIPKSQNSERPEPYYYLLDIDNVIDVQETKLKSVIMAGNSQYDIYKVEYIIFHDIVGETVAAFDDTYYRLLRKKKDGEYDVEVETQHSFYDDDGNFISGIGYCPAKMFWNTPVNNTTTLVKESPITNSLTELDWLLFYETSKKRVDIYAPWPIFSGYKRKCDYKHESGARCVGGFILLEKGTGKEERIKCPDCESKSLAGPGSYVAVDPPSDKDQPDLRNPIQILTVPPENLQYIRDEIKYLQDDIFLNCVGKGGEPNNDQAQNEKQIQSAFESRENVLLNIKRGFEIIHQFAMETVCRIRYGNKFLKCTIDYGSRFYLNDPEVAIANYQVAKTAGLPAFELAIQRELMYESKYKNNPDLKERVKILSNLEPYPDYTIEQLQVLMTTNPTIVNLDDFVLKINFDTFVKRFEREQLNIILFGIEIPFDEKINSIKQILYNYVKEQRQITSTQSNDPANGGTEDPTSAGNGAFDKRKQVEQPQD